MTSLRWESRYANGSAYLAGPITAEASHPWVRLSTSGGAMTEQTRVSVEIDWERVPEGTHDAKVTFTGAGNSFDVPLRVLDDGERARKRVRGFVEAHGYVSIDAAHFDGT